MRSTRIHKVIEQLISCVRRLGIWHGEDTATVSQLRLKSICFIYYLFFFISISIGAIKQETLDESVFTVEVAIAGLVVMVILWILLWKQKEILRLLNRICVFTIRYDEELIKIHLQLRGLIDEVESFLSKLFLLQFATSGLCICGSIYCLAFDIGDNNVERFVHVYMFFYNIAVLFTITYLGNEITLSSSRLIYSLFESDWIDQPQATKKCILVFGEYLKQSHELLIGKLYPLTLETFTRILNSAYRLFNILKNFK